ncbi:Der GTPase-activating protein YihI [Alteromonas sp. ASW11-130]|uniref:Der GTPase-activating protein YihI n=1 Tax=Alteromonas sp. ASW11-130 TaxID=3015775 RepID=UPI002241A6CA|nr:Der GTPase-activating protein YihI [Alteromonas sp. ASW11-130]MCW8093448.1 Der GTPase-activating protein YihI [Alteromonas sp. ASW11-130]
MPRKKKSRKVGLIGVRKDPNAPRPPKAPKRTKPSKGKPAGSRHNVASTNKSTTQKKGISDPRIGSKKPVSLVAKTTPAEKRHYATPAEELADIEADERLALLLDRLEGGAKLNAGEQQYIDEKMARHRILCELLGIADDEDQEDQESSPLDSIEQLNIDDFKE